MSAPEIQATRRHAYEGLAARLGATPILDTPPVARVHEPIDETPVPVAWASRPQFHVLLLLVAAALWLWSLQITDLRDMGDYGLLSALPITFYLALAVLTVGFLFGVRREASNRLLAPYLVLFIAIVHASPVFLYGTLRYAWAWKHVGVVDYFMRHHALDPHLSFLPVYQNWPGFFGLTGALTEAVGFKSALSFAAWAPPVFELLNVAALWVLVGSLTSDRRVRWTTCWFFLIANWVGQDYFSPQAFAYFLYLVALGIVLKSLSKRPAAPKFVRRHLRVLRATTEPAEADAVTQVPVSWGTVGIVSVIFAAVATSHPLTPIVLTAALVGLAVFGVLRVRALPVIMAAMTVGWLFTGAHTYYSGSSSTIFKGVGSFSTNISSNLQQLSHVVASQRIISQVGRLQVAYVALLAVFGLFRRISRGSWDAAAAVLLVAPIAILVGGNYDGEALFRVFLFALPFAAFFMALLLYPSPDAGRGTYPAIVAILISAFVLVGFLFAYYGKEAWSYFTPGEVRAASIVYEHAPPGTLLVEGTRDYPNQFEDAERFTYVTLATEPKQSIRSVIDHPAQVLADWLTDSRHPQAYILITRSQKAETDALGPFPKGALARIEAALMASPKFDVVYHDQDATLIRAYRRPLKDRK